MSFPTFSGDDLLRFVSAPRIPSVAPSGVVFATVAAILLAYFILRSADDLQAVPTPPNPSWLWGHDAAVYEASAGETYRRWFDDYGPLVKIRGAFWHPYLLVAADLEVTKHILQTKIYDYHHSKIVRPRIERLLGKSLGWVEGAQEHRRMRRLVAGGLSLESVRAMTPIIYEAAGSVASKLAQLASTASKSDSSIVVNILDWTGKATLSITGRASFSHDFDSGESADAQQILGAWRRMAGVGVSWKGFFAICLLRRLPFLNYIPIKANRAHSVVKTTIQDGVASTMIERSRRGEADEGKDLLGLLIKALANDELSSQEVKDHISMFIMAGYETTSQTLAYTIWELACHPVAQSRLRQEVRSFGVEPSYDDFHAKLPFLDAVCRESLRLHPGLPYMERVATRDDVIPLASPLRTKGGKTITHLHVKAGQIIVTPIISIHQQASVWEDATKWKPERWFSPSTLPDPAKMPKGWGNLLTFSDGPRNCVGQRLGLFQYKAILFKLVESLEFIDTGAEITSKVASSLQPCISGKIDEGPNLPVRVRALG